MKFIQFLNSNHLRYLNYLKIKIKKNLYKNSIKNKKFNFRFRFIFKTILKKYLFIENFYVNFFKFYNNWILTSKFVKSQLQRFTNKEINFHCQLSYNSVDGLIWLISKTLPYLNIKYDHGKLINSIFK